MAKRNIITVPDPLLYKKCRPVEVFDEKLAELLDDLTDTVANKLYRSIPTLVERSISMRTDSSFYVTASYISRGTTYVDRSLKEPVMYFYFYRDGNPAVVNLSPGRDGAVSMAAYFLPEGEISGSGEDSLRDDLEELIYDNLDLELDLEVKELK